MVDLSARETTKMNTIETLQVLARSGKLIATEHGVYMPHDRYSEVAECPATGHVWDGTVDESPCPPDHAHLSVTEVSLLGSDTADTVTADELGITEVEYNELIVESLASDQAEGHVEASTGYRVYAA
jgi:hypothetical protein